MSSSSRQSDERYISFLALDQFMREVRQLLPLSAEEEARLLERVERGKHEQQHPQPNAWRLMLAQNARHRLVEGYLPLVIHLARVHQRYFSGMQFLDLVQEGSLGLLKAVDEHDPRTGCPFRKLAGACVRVALVKALQERDGLVRISHRVHDFLSTMHTTERRLQRVLGREPSHAEVAQAMGVEEQHIEQMLETKQQAKVESLHALLERLDDIDEDKLDLIGLYEPTAGIATERQVLLREKLHQALARLPERQRQVLILRYGLEDQCEPRTQAEIGRTLGLVEPTVQYAEEQAKVALYRLLQEEIERKQPQQVLTSESQRAYYTRIEAMHTLGCSATTLNRQVRRGRLQTMPHPERKGKRCFLKTSVDALAAEQARASCASLDEVA